MNVAKLIELLKELPPDARPLYPNGEYQGSNSEVTKVVYHESASWGQPGNTVVLS